MFLSLKANSTHHLRHNTSSDEDPFIGYRGSKIKHDKQAWQAFKSGDPAAFSYIYSKYIDDLYNYGCHIITDHELVKDAIQDVFIELNHYGKKLDNVNSIKAYLYVSLRRKIICKLKLKKQYTHFSLYNDDESFEVEISPELNLINNQIAEERAKRLEKIINGLSQKQRRAIVYYYYEGFSYKEIAQLLALKNAKSARKLLYRAIKSLRKQLKLRGKQVRNVFFLI